MYLYIALFLLFTISDASPPNGHIEADKLTEGKTLEEMVFESLSPPTDAARRRHRSTGDRTSWTIHQSLRKRNVSGGSGSASPVAMLLESDPEMAKDIFGSDVKILQTLTHSPLNHSRTSSNNFHCGRTPEVEETVHQRSRSLGSKPNFWELKTGDGSSDPVSQKELTSLCDEIKAFSAEEPKQDVQSDEVKGNDLLISFDDNHSPEEETPKNSLDSDSLTRTDISDSSERTSEVIGETKPASTANGGVSDDLLFKVPEAPLPKCNGDIVHKSEDGEEEEDKKSTAEVTASSEDLDKTDQESTDIDDTSSPIFQKGTNKQSPEPSKTRTPKIQKTPQRNSFLASVFTSPFSPRFSKPAINKTLSMASSQMENVGASFRAKATDLASKFGEYTRTLSNPGTPRSGVTGKASTGSLIDLDLDQPDLPEMGSSWSDKFFDSNSLDDLGIMMPLSLAGMFV